MRSYRLKLRTDAAGTLFGLGLPGGAAGIALGGTLGGAVPGATILLVRSNSMSSLPAAT